MQPLRDLGKRAGRSGRGSILRWLTRVAVAAVALAIVLTSVGFQNARADPVVRRVSVKLPGWPAGTRPVRVLLWSDIHLGNPATGPARLARLVDRADALHPDLIILAGDFIAGHRPADAAAAPGLDGLRDLHAPGGVIAVMGNHEYWTDAPRVRRVLEQAGVTVLTNAAVRRGPLVIGGLDDMVNHREHVSATVAAMRELGGVPLVVSHSPDIAPRLPAALPLLLAGHTHCGQVVVPGHGPPVEVSQPRYRCGLIREGGRLTVVTAGTGTSVVPLRWGAPPDWWLLTLGP